MKHQTLLWLIVIAGAALLILYATTQYNEARADRLHAEAAIIRAQSQARLDATSANLPYLILGVTTVFSSALIFLGVTIYLKAAPPPPHIETHTIILLPADLTRRQQYQALTQLTQLQRGDQ